ncbi:beta-lactamase family protein [Olivibacter sp. SDN3]|nr:beta-lactamase family protein [Olivibacter sp. SDN3]
MKRPLLLAILLFSLLFGRALFAQQLFDKNTATESNGFSNKRLLRIDKLIQQYIDSNWVKGAVGFIAKDGYLVYHKAFGIDDIQRGTPMQGDAIFRIASQTKAITSIAVMMLFEEGKFLLDDPISRYIPAFANPSVLQDFNEADTTYTTIPAKNEITIRHLLTHTSGIDYAQMGSSKMKAIYAKAGIAAGFLPHKQLLADAIDTLGKLPLIHHPGEQWTYSLSTDVLGRLVEIISGMSLDEFLTQRLFIPLGMHDTYFHLPEGKRSRLVQVYTEDPENRQIELWKEDTFPGLTVDYPINNNGYYAGGAGLVSTISDYAIFLQMLINGGVYNGSQLLSRRTVDMITMNQIGEHSLGDNKFGLGFEVITKKGMAKLGQSTGSFAWGGFFGTIFWADPKEKIVALLFIQQHPFSHGELHDKFKALVYQALK